MGVGFDVERFERVDASSVTTLLRLAATVAEPARLDPARLVVDDGTSRRRVQPLQEGPARDARAGAWRAAFAVPTAVLDRGPVSFALETAQAQVVDLPAPRRADLRPAAVRPSETADVPAPAPAPSDEELRALREEAASQRERADALQRALDALGDRHAELEERLAAAPAAPAHRSRVRRAVTIVVVLLALATAMAVLLTSYGSYCSGHPC